MNPLDWFLALLLAWSILRALLRGLFRELFALAGLLLGLILACTQYTSVAPRLTPWLPSSPTQPLVAPPLVAQPLVAPPLVAQLAAFLLLLLGTLLLATLLGRLLRRAASAVGLGLFDRLLGALFGALRGCLLAAALLLALTAFLPASPPWNLWIQTSLLAPYFLRAIHAVSFVMPYELHTRLLDGLQLLKHNSPDWIKLPSASHNTL